MRFVVHENEDGDRVGSIVDIDSADAWKLACLVFYYKKHVEDKFSVDRMIGSRTMFMNEINDLEIELEKYDNFYWTIEGEIPIEKEYAG